MVDAFKSYGFHLAFERVVNVRNGIAAVLIQLLVAEIYINPIVI